MATFQYWTKTMRYQPPPPLLWADREWDVNEWVLHQWEWMCADVIIIFIMIIKSILGCMWSQKLKARTLPLSLPLWDHIFLHALDEAHIRHTLFPEPRVQLHRTGPSWVSTTSSHAWPFCALTSSISWSCCAPVQPQSPPSYLRSCDPRSCSVFSISHPEPPLSSDCFHIKCSSYRYCKPPTALLSPKALPSLFLLSALSSHRPQQPYHRQHPKALHPIFLRYLSGKPK